MLTLVRSLNFRYYAVSKVTKNSGGKTPGVDGFIIQSREEFFTMVEEITNIKDYKCSPLRRVHIQKSGNSLRPLGIPTIKDRCMQQLVTLVLEPIVELNSDSESYGYRKYRSAKNAIGSIRSLLKSESHRRYAAEERKWILDADIRGFFDNINHEWLLKNTPLPSALLKLLEKWLKSGVIYKEQYASIETGTPQGGIISPILANMTLNGLESIIKNSIKPLTSSIAMRRVFQNKYENKVWLRLFVRSVRYADDFIIFARSKFIIQTYIKPAVEAFLKERGLSLSPEKTSIFCIQNRELKFLGFVFKHRTDWRVKYGMIKERLGIKEGIALYPDKDKVKEVIKKIKNVINRSQNISAYELITKLNPIIRGWNNYFNIGNSSKFRKKVEHVIFNAVRKWAIQKHSRWGIRRITKTYFICNPKYRNRVWNFHGVILNNSHYTNSKNGKTIYLQSVWDINTIAANQFNFTNELKNIHAYHEDRKKLWDFNLKNKIRRKVI
jgi:RNA-directed DNA polymerase